MKRKKIIFAIVLLFIIAVIHLRIPERDLTLHILLRLLYLAPIAYVALLAGLRGGILTSLAATLVFLPHFFFSGADQEFIVGNITAVFLFNLTGFFVGYFRDVSERGYINRRQQKVVIAPEVKEHRVLFYVDNSPLSSGVANWFGSSFGSRDMSVTLFWVYNDDISENFASQQMADEHAVQFKKDEESILGGIRDLLTDTGIPADRISIKRVALHQKARVSDKILEELTNGSYDLVLMPKHEQTKAQEFLFGDTAIRLLRESHIPVISVKGTLEKSISAPLNS